jgi:hypothetical protein
MNAALKQKYVLVFHVLLQTHNLAKQIVMTDKLLCSFSVCVSVAAKHLRDQTELMSCGAISIKS